jgi:hypothetical protein
MKWTNKLSSFQVKMLRVSIGAVKGKTVAGAQIDSAEIKIKRHPDMGYIESLSASLG